MEKYLKNSTSNNTAFFIATVIASVTLAFLSFIIRMKAFQQTPYVIGWDGYFYLIQIKSLLEEGQMHAADLSFFYSFLMGIKYLVGDYVLAYKIAAASLSTLFVFLFYFLAQQWSQSFYLAVLLASVMLFSPHLTYFAAQYPKNLLGLVFFLAFLWSLNSQKWWLPLILLILNYFGHRLSLGLCLVFLSFYLLVKIIQTSSRKKRQYALTFGLTSLLILLILNFIFPQLLNIVDLGRFENSFSKMPHFAPYTFFVEFGKDRISAIWGMEIFLTAVLFLLSFPFIIKSEKKEWSIPLFLLCIILIFPFFKWSFTGMAYRFYLVFVLIVPLFIALLISKKEAKKNKILISGIAILFILSSSYTYRSYNPAIHDPSYSKYEKITQAALPFLKNDQVELVIAHNALAEYFTFTTGIDALPWLPEYKIEKEKLWRIATDIRLSLLEQYLNPEEIKSTHRLSVRYFLIREDLWQKVLEQMKIEKEEDILEQLNTWRNPHKIRPTFLLQKKE